METLAQEELQRTLRVNEVPVSVLRALKVKAAQEGKTVRATVIEAIRQFTAENEAAGNPPERANYQPAKPAA